MAYFLKSWINPKDGSERLYVQGTTRQSVYLTQRKSDGALVWSSKASDTPHKFQTGDHYGKIKKDRAAVEEVCEAYGLILGGGADQWDRARHIAVDGIGSSDDE